MSLIKQLWLGIVVLLLLALGGSFIISFLSAKTYLEEQLSLKNIDNATSLALSMSQMDKDPVTLELLLSAQFDAGHYESITLFDPQDQVLIERHFDAPLARNVPDWFSHLVVFHPQKGTALVQDGWRQFGRLEIVSHSGYAVEALWKSARELGGWFVVACLLGGLLGSLVLRYVSRPLDVVVSQAEAIGERRFIISEEPNTSEFKRVVRAMNRLSNGVRLMLEKDSRQLDSLRRETQRDSLTGLCNRSHFLNILSARLKDENASPNGLLALVRVNDLAQLNIRMGRQRVDNLLRRLAQLFESQNAHYPNTIVGRLNGRDYALLMPINLDALEFAIELKQLLRDQLTPEIYDDLALPMALIKYRCGDLPGKLMQSLDGALAQATMKGNHASVLAELSSQEPTNLNLEDWRSSILNALTNDRLTLASFAVNDTQGALVHLDAPVRLTLDDIVRPAGFFIPWASRLGLLPNIDLAVARAALSLIAHNQQPLAINISEDSLCNASFRTQLLALCELHRENLPHLWLDFPETCALRHLDGLRSFTAQLARLGCHPGLEHLGLEFSEFQELQDLGLSHLKIDAALVRDIDKNPTNQVFIQGMCRIGHSLGVIMIAEGVQTREEQITLEKIGLDAFTGPAISKA